MWHFMAAQEGENRLGVVGIRRGDFGNMLGLTPETAARRIADAEKRKKGEIAEDAPADPPAEQPSSSGDPGPSSAGEGGE
mgnify:CR=1 FL=1